MLFLIFLGSHQYYHPTIASLRGSFSPEASINTDEVEFDFSKLMCTFEAFNDKDKCSSAVTQDGKSCSYCNMAGTEDEEGSGLCVNPDLAEQMTEMNPQVVCDDGLETTSVKSVTPFDFSYFSCTLAALNDEDACAKASTDDPCQYCNISINGNDLGLCVNPEIADELKNISDQINCNDVSSPLVEVSHDVTSVSLQNPITDCNINGVDDLTCLDPSKVNGSECIWCDAGIGGFCFPKDWADTASRFLDCKTSIMASDQKEKIDYKVKENVNLPSSSCILNGFSDSPDVCRSSIDEETGENCIFCSSSNLGNYGLCLPPSFKGKEGSFYTCDEGVGNIVETY